MNSVLVGAWEICEENPQGWRGILVFTEKHHAHVFEDQDRFCGFKGEQPTEAEEAEAYRTMRAGGGTWTISGNILTLNEEFSRIPMQDLHVSFQFDVKGDKLTLVIGGENAVFTKVS